MKNYFKVIFKYAVVSLLIIAGAFLGQIGQHLKAVNDVRLDSIAHWIAKDQNRAILAEEFITKCIKGKPKAHNKFDPIGDRKRIDGDPLSVYQCGESIGASDLVAVIKGSDNVLTSYAWPLSLADPT